MGKGYRTGPVGKYGNKSKGSTGRGKIFYKNEIDPEKDVAENPNVKVRSANDNKKFITKRGPKPAVEKPLNLNVKEHKTEEEAVSHSYKQLVSSLVVSDKYKDLFKKRKMEELGEDEDELAGRYGSSDDEEDENEDDQDLEEEEEEEEPAIVAKKKPKVEPKKSVKKQPKDDNDNDNAVLTQKRFSKKVEQENEEEKEEEEEEEQAEQDPDEEITEETLLQNGFEEEIVGDTFSSRFETLHTEEIEAYIQQKPKLHLHKSHLLGNQVMSTHPIPAAKPPQLKSKLFSQLSEIKKKREIFNEFQTQVFSVLNEYSDFFYAQNNENTSRDLRETYVVHALNHIFKTRDKVLKGNAKRNANKDVELKDQGFTRPRVLILVPFRNTAWEVVNMILEYSPKNHQLDIANKKRFKKEFTLEQDPGPSQYKPDEWNQIFKGNIDDCFRMGISFNTRSIKLYSPFYASDIIVASPLGLRLSMGEGSDLDYDFLSSIEMVICESCDVFTMQNWEHVQFIFENMNLVPKQPRDTDFSRVKDWYLNQWAKYYRQTILLAPFITADMNALWNKNCFNTKGSFKCKNTVEDGSIVHVVPKIRQIFYRLQCENFAELDDFRFQHFQNEVLPQLVRSVQTKTLIFIPSYFDFVRLRNYFRKEELEFCQVSEYTEHPAVARARSKFFDGAFPFMLFTERFHFFNRMRIRGIENIVFYGLPQYPQFYSEMLNLIEAEDTTCTVLFSKFEKLQLERIVGTARCQRMIDSEKATFMFC